MFVVEEASPCVDTHFLGPSFFLSIGAVFFAGMKLSFFLVIIPHRHCADNKSINFVLAHNSQKTNESGAAASWRKGARKFTVEDRSRKQRRKIDGS